MAINHNLFIHDSDKAALDALKAVPGFNQVVKAFMSVYSEKQFKITNMSSNVRISESQLPHYYGMLLRVCDKLKIDVPEMYLELNVNPNAYTYGDENPFIVITSGLLETLPDNLIETVIAHECGHILCHHTLYRTMGSLLLSGAFSFLPIPGIALVPIQAAFSYWMRCSEFSADRVSIICDRTADKMAEVCARFAGFDKDINADINMEEFMSQAKEYKEMIKSNTWNKTLELMMYMNNSHPLNAVRAYEAVEWVKTDQYKKVIAYLDKENLENPDSIDIPTPWSSSNFVGMNYLDAKQEIKNSGFKNIILNRVHEKPSLFTKEGNVVSVSLNSEEKFKVNYWASPSAKFVITYYLPLTKEEIKEMHPGESVTPLSNKNCLNKSADEIAELFKNEGFTNIKTVGQRDLISGKEKNANKVVNVTINRQSVFSKGDWFNSDAEIVITFHDRI